MNFENELLTRTPDNAYVGRRPRFRRLFRPVYVCHRQNSTGSSDNAAEWLVARPKTVRKESFGALTKICDPDDERGSRVSTRPVYSLKGPHNKYVHDVIYWAIKKGFVFSTPRLFGRSFLRFSIFFFFSMGKKKKIYRPVNYRCNRWRCQDCHR